MATRLASRADFFRRVTDLEQKHGRAAYYVVSRRLSYTNVCYTHCQFCAFQARPGDPKAYVLTAEAIVKEMEKPENLGVRVLPAPGKVTADGKLDDWDLSIGTMTCCDVETQREKFGVWTHAMYDDKCL